MHKHHHQRGAYGQAPPDPTSAVYEPTALGQVIAAALLASITEEVGRPVTLDEALVILRGLREHTPDPMLPDPEEAERLLPFIISAQQIAALLRARPDQPLCDDCIAAQAGVPTTRAASITAALAETREFAKRQVRCSGCGETKLATRVAW